MISTERSWNTAREEVESLSTLLHGTDHETSTHLTRQAWETPGSLLFHILFGPEENWENILRILFNQPAPAPRPNPIRAPVWLRICTDDALLLGLPWQLTSWNHYRLAHHGWDFSTTQVLHPTDSYTTTAPCNVLIVAPRGEVDGVAPDSTHPRAIIDVLQQVWPTGREPGYMRLVRTRQELDNALRGMRPHLIYVYGHGTVAGGRPSLLLDGEQGPEAVSLTALAEVLKEAPPAAIYLHVTGLGAAELTPSQVLGSIVPLVIWRRLSYWSPEATSQAVAWLRHWLQQRTDPIKALHEVTKRADTVEAAMVLGHSSYRTWQTQAYQHTALQERLPHLQLDRDEQKALVDKHVRELVRSDNRRVMALVAYAEGGNMLRSLHQQLQHYLELEIADLAEINWRRLQFPVTRDHLRSDLEAELQLQLNADHNEPLPYLLRRHAPRVVGTGKRGILWLNWGVFGREVEQQAALTPAQLSAWLRFCSEILGSYCPEDLRIVSYAAIELEQANHQRLAEELGKQRWEPWCRRPEFRFSVLPPLGNVSEDHLFDFLVDGNSSCDAGIQEEITQRLIDKTAGSFEAITSLMQAAEHGSWYDLLAQLRREQGAEQQPEDDTPF